MYSVASVWLCVHVSVWAITSELFLAKNFKIYVRTFVHYLGPIF